MGKKIFMYLLFSGITGALYMGFLFLLEEIVHAPGWVSVTGAYIAAMVFYFVVNRGIVFQKAEHAPLMQSVLRFALLIGANYVLTVAIVEGLRRITNEPYTGSVVAGVVTISLTYFVFDRVLFPSAQKTPAS